MVGDIELNLDQFQAINANMFEEPYPVLAFENLWLPGYGL